GQRVRTSLVRLVSAGLVLITGGAMAVVNLRSYTGQTSEGSSAALQHGPGSAGGGGAAQGAAPSSLPSYNRQTITSSSLLTRILNGERGPLVATDEGGLSQERLNACASGVARV